MAGSENIRFGRYHESEQGNSGNHRVWKTRWKALQPVDQEKKGRTQAKATKSE